MTQSGLNYTSRLLNYVEPYYIDGVAKSAFYTEVNTNLTKNSKVFLTNGFNDSEVYINRGKYVKNADGYRVLYVDKCKVVLDINYNGITQSYKEDDFDNFLKVYHIRSQREFNYINKLFVDTYSNIRVSKFEKNYTNNIIFSDKIWAGATGIGYNGGLSSTGQFWARRGQTWVNVTNQFNYNTFTFSSDYYSMGLTCNGRIYPMGEDINYAGKSYKQRNIYKFTDPNTINSWKIDTEYKAPIMSKLYFKEGIFRGKHNDGIFGSYDKEQDWFGTQSEWTSGFFVNSNWKSGLMGSKSTNTLPSYYASLNKGVPIQTTDFSNNKGAGYNYILDSNVYSGLLENGNFINCNIGPTSTGLTAIDIYLGSSDSFELKTNGGLYNYCDINNSEISDSTTLDSIVQNSYLNNTKTLNSQISESYSYLGEFSVNNGISVISADMMSYIPTYLGNTSSTSSNIRGILKLYIDDSDYLRLDTFDNFFITKINKDYILSSLNSDQKILLPFETRYVLDTFWDFKVSSINQECIASIKSKFDNKSKVEVIYNNPNYINTFTNNTNNYASIDIDLGKYLAFFRVGPIYTYLNQSIIKSDNVQNLFLKTNITNSDFRNGVIEKIKWTSGSNVNYPSNIIKVENNKLKITKSSSSEIDVYLNESRPTIDDNELKVGSYVWIDSISHIDTSGAVSSISGIYKISSVTSYPGNSESKIVLSNSTLIGPLGGAGTYSVVGGSPTYVSINKLLIDDSEIDSGLFVRTLFTNSTFVNEEFNNNDRDITNSNIQKLRFVNLLFNENNNTIKSGLIHKSHIINANWISGISNNSIWNGATFGGGVFNNGYWIDGTFNNGYFQNSKDIVVSTVDYSFNQDYRNWLKGTFNNGSFYNSVWIDGTFNNGKFYNSDWYGGTWNNGILGDKNIPTLNTNMSKSSQFTNGATQTIWNDGIVENAQVGGYGIVYWNGGKFNGGVFTSYDDKVTPFNESIWYDGEFNGGNFSNLAKWINGTFNKGKFTSHYGWTYSSSTQSSDYSWENGVFNGGQFGLGSYATNSTWYYGEFNDGQFQGRVWNNGIFQNGTFNGGSTYSSINNESNFTESFTQSYYGLWRNGWVTDIKHKAATNELISSNNLRNNQTAAQKVAVVKNTLWLTGIFDHPSGTIENSSWLDGNFKSGTFRDGVFNPYVNRSHWDTNYTTTPSFNFSSFNCLWTNGTFDNGTFYISDWYDGKFLNGTMSGARWINGVWEYGYAKNIYWTDGNWKNGMWDGSPYNSDNLDNSNVMINGKDKDILLRVANVTRDGKMHIINAFTGTYSSELLLDGSFSNPYAFYGWTYSDTGSLTNWSASYPNGVSLDNLNLTYPTLYTISESFGSPYYTFTLQVANVNVGDKFIVNIYSGAVSVTAVAGDTTNTIANKLANRITNGLYQNIVETYQYNPYGPPILQLVTWSYFSSNNYITANWNFDDTIDVTFNSSTFAYGNAIFGGTSSSYNESETLYALSLTASQSIFTSISRYVVSLDVYNTGGRTDFIVGLGDNIYNETINGNLTMTYNYSYTPIIGALNDTFYIKRVLYQNPDNSSFKVSGASIKNIVSVYSNSYNNKLYQFATFSTPFTYGPTSSSINLPSILTPYIISDRENVSIKFGTGAFKAGIWEGGYWNNGWRSKWDATEIDTIIFTDVIIGSVIEVSNNLWNITLQAFTDTTGLNIGDRVAIGNIVCMDVNENRRLIKSYYRIVGLSLTTITVEVSLNMPVRRIIKDSENHMMYVTKNIWLSGVFHNGYFSGVWNYGLFKGYPYITNMENSHWIDGVFDGGRFASTQSYYLSGGATNSYNTGLVQNFTFRDNNIADKSQFLYNSWIDVNYVTYSMTNIFKDNQRYDDSYGVIISDGNLKGFPTFDVLSSDSIFRNSFDTNYKYYKLGSKYKVYTDYIGDDSYFTYPLSTNGAPGVDDFVSKGWIYTNNSTSYRSNTGNADDSELVVNYDKVSFTNIGIKSVQTASLIFYRPGNISNGWGSSVGSFIGDYADFPGVIPYTFTKEEIGGSPVSMINAFSTLSYTFSNWPLNTQPALSTGVLFDYPSLTPGLSIPGDTDLVHRRAYMLDYFNLSSTDTNYGGYMGYTGYSPFVSTGFNGVTYSFSAFRAKADTTLLINAFVPFTFSADESSRGGWSIFKFIGVVERCGTASNPLVESNWSYVTNTKLDFYGNSGYSSNGYSIDKDSCCVGFDGNVPKLLGKLYMNGVTIPASAGDYIRFRLYWIDLRKMFASSNSGQSPGYMNFKIGVDPLMGYTDNNHGYFEIYDTSTYTNTSTNLLDNTLTKDIEKFRYSIVDFDLNRFAGSKYQGTTGSLPSIYLLNDYSNVSTPNNFSTVINHSDYLGNHKEYFYNRKSLEMFFRSTDSFQANFGKIGFYESDMIPFFRYTTSVNVDASIKTPLHGTASYINNFNGSISLYQLSLTQSSGG